MEHEDWELALTLNLQSPISNLQEASMTDINVGDTAPDFALMGVITKPQVSRTEVKLSDYRGRKKVVIAFHTFAFTAT
jgi:hypothetical protein